MEVEIKTKEMFEDIAGNAADGLLRDRGEDSVAEFLKESGANSGSAVWAELEKGWNQKRGGVG